MFQVDEHLAADTIELDRWPLCRVLLMNDANYPWLILVPARPGIREIDELGEADRRTLLDEISRAYGVLRRMLNPHKLNVAALGNQVPQLHVHVIGRFTSDPAWPRPVWGVLPAKPYTDEALTTFRQRFAAAASA